MTGLNRHEALVRTGRHVRLTEVETPLPEPGGLLVELSYVGICGTDLQILNGTRPDTAEILGHEGIGRVIRVGAGAPIRNGATVIFNPTAELAMGRILGHNTPGLFQRQIAVSARTLCEGLVLPALRLEEERLRGALVEPLACVIYGHELIRNRVPQLRSAIIFGAGPVGLLASLYLKTHGARVLVVHNHQTRFDTATKLGLLDPAETVLLSPDQRVQSAAWRAKGYPLQRRILSASRGEPLDAAFICTTRAGAPTALQHALEVVRDGGCIDLVTNYPEEASPPTCITTQALRAVRAANVSGVPQEGEYCVVAFEGRRIAVTGHRGAATQHLMSAMHELEAPSSPYAKIVTHIVPLREAASALETLARRGTPPPGSRFVAGGTGGGLLQGRDCIKAVIDMHPGDSGAR
jgi:threonine dehydrogenase-like Zn-dependent dehydrogenase